MSSSMTDRKRWTHGLERGLGRCFDWRDVASIDKTVIEDACLRDLRYDQQSEGCRGRWLWELLKHHRQLDEMRLVVLDSLDTYDDEHGDHRYSLALCYAQAGDTTFIERIKQAPRRWQSPHGRPTGLDAMTDLFGLEALSLIAEQLCAFEDDEDAEGFLANIMLQCFFDFDRNQVTEVIRTARFTDPRWQSVIPKVLASEWFRPSQHPPAQRAPFDPRSRFPDANSVITACQQSMPGRYLLGQWGKTASAEERQAVFEAMIRSTRHEEIQRLLWFFSEVGLPCHHHLALDWCRDPNSDLSDAASVVLGKVRQPDVRQLALDWISSNQQERAMQLLVANFEPSDEPMILDALQSLPQEVDSHSVYQSLNEMIQRDDPRVALSLALLGYAQTPCGYCRREVLQALLRQNRAPDSMILESRFDSERRTRELAGGPTWNEPAKINV